MLKFGNKEFRNLQEQVYANMKNISDIITGTTVLAEFGIKVVGQVDESTDLPDPETYEGEYGDAYIVGTEEPYEYYIYTRPFEESDTATWFDLGVFPQPGPQGETGPQGPQGIQGPQGNPGSDGAAAGFGTISATAQTLVPGSSATASVVASGPNTEKNFAFTFGIPKGADGQDGQDGVGIEMIEYGDTTISPADLLASVKAGGTVIVSKLDQDEVERQHFYLCDVVTNSNESQIDMYFMTEYSNGAKTDAYISETYFTSLNGTVTWHEPIVYPVGGSSSEVAWGEITGTLSSQTDLANALSGKADVGDSYTIAEENALLAEKLDKVVTTASTPRAYVVSTSGTQDVISITPSNTASTIASRNSSGNIQVGTPSNNSDAASKKYVDDGLAEKQATLVSGTNIKTINNESILGSGNITIQGGGVSDVEVNGTSVVSGGVASVTVPTDTGDLTNNAGFITSSALSGYATETWVGQQGFLTSVSWSDVSGKPSFATVATSGSYNDLSNKPTIPSVSANPATTTATLTGITIDGTSYAVSTGAPANMVTTDTNQSITGEKTFSAIVVEDTISLVETVSDAVTNISCAATSDVTLTLPSSSGTIALTSDIPSVSNMVTTDTAQTISGVKTFSNGISVESITIADVLTVPSISVGEIITGTTDSITVPSNKSGTLAVTSDIPSTMAWSSITGKPTFATVATSGSYADLSNKPTIPTKVSDLTNDSGFQTASDVSSTLSSYSTTSAMNTAISTAISSQSKETWTFTLSDGTTVTKTVVLG